jgi:hypothetical protein
MNLENEKKYSLSAQVRVMLFTLISLKNPRIKSYLMISKNSYIDETGF